MSPLPAAGGGQLSPVRLTLAGVALAAVLEGLSNGIALLNPDVYDQLRFWQAGSLDIRTLETLKVVVIPVMIAAAVALGLPGAEQPEPWQRHRYRARQPRGANPVDGISGHHRAVRQCDGSGRPDCLYRTDDAASVALAGGADHRWSLPVTLLATPALLLFADVVGRLLVPGELRVSVVSAFIGAPVLIFRYDVNAEVVHDGPSRRLIVSVSLLVIAILMLAIASAAAR